MVTQSRTIEDYITSDEAAKVLKKTRRRVLQLLRSGELPSVKKGSVYLIHKEDLKKYRLEHL